MTTVPDRWAALDAPSLMRPQRFDPVAARDHDEPWIDIRAPEAPNSEWFERIAVAHMNSVLGIAVAALTSKGAPFVDVAVPGDRFAVGQVKSGKQVGDAHVLADAVAGARIPGSAMLSRHAFVYTESGYKGGSLARSGDLLQFLFTIDKRGFVRPWNRAARRIGDPEVRRRFLPRSGSGTLLQLMRRHDRQILDPGYERSVLTWLDFCTSDGYDDVIRARVDVGDYIEDLWRSAKLPEKGLAPTWRDFLAYALEEGELTGQGAEAAQHLVDRAEFVISEFSRFPEQAATGNDLWGREVYVRPRRTFARKRLLSIAQQGFFADEDGLLPPKLQAMADQAWQPEAKWVTAEHVWREFLLSWDSRADIF